MKQQDIYIPVSVEERLPMDSIECFTIDDIGTMMKLAFDKPSKKFYDSEGYSIPVTYWLEKKTDLIVCTKEDLKDMWFDSKVEDNPEIDNKYKLDYWEYIENKGIK
jgi:hypothetical protein